jgi:hypothetical protein
MFICVLYGAISQKIATFITSDVRTSNPMHFQHFLSMFNVIGKFKRMWKALAVAHFKLFSLHLPLEIKETSNTLRYDSHQLDQDSSHRRFKWDASEKNHISNFELQ